MENKFLIILGTEKAGTTSLYEYFVGHPKIYASINKETDYFRKENVNIVDYLKCFRKPTKFEEIGLESSPGYLGLSTNVAKNIFDTLGEQVNLVAVLRDPIDRLKSSFSFHKSKQYISKDFDINEYIELCFKHYHGNLKESENPFPSEWFLNVLDAGKYKKHITNYYRYFDKEKLMLVDFSSLKKDVAKVTKDIANFTGIETNYFDDFNFYTANQTFHVKNSSLHKIGMKVNNTLEPFLRKNPKVKRKILDCYKLINGDKGHKEREITSSNYDLLRDFYFEDYMYIESYFKSKNEVIEWKNFHEK